MSNADLLQRLQFLPSGFLERLLQIIPEKFWQQSLESFLHMPSTAFRVNNLKITTAECLDILTKKNFHLQQIPWHSDLYTIPFAERRALTETSEFQQGLFYIQNPSSVVPVLLLDPKPNEEILDLAAAPGGKTINIAIQMQNQGKIAAVEAVKSRFHRLSKNLKTYGVTIVRTFLKDGSSVYRFCPQKFDRVLLDAPCSSEARFNIHSPESYAYWSEKKISEMTRKQKKLLYSAFQSLKPEGILVYCTCSFAPEENEMMIQYLIDKFPHAVHIEKIDLPFTNLQKGLQSWNNQTFSQEIKNAVRILPNEMMESFFICKIRKLLSTHK